MHTLAPSMWGDVRSQARATPPDVFPSMLGPGCVNSGPRFMSQIANLKFALETFFVNSEWKTRGR